MSQYLEQSLIYHITDVESLPGILTDGGLLSDAAMSNGEYCEYRGRHGARHRASIQAGVATRVK